MVAIQDRVVILMELVDKHMLLVNNELNSPEDIMTFIEAATVEKIAYQSQKPTNEKICPHCKGKCFKMDHNGVDRRCKECNALGIIKE